MLGIRKIYIDLDKRTEEKRKKKQSNNQKQINK